MIVDVLLRIVVWIIINELVIVLHLVLTIFKWLLLNQWAQQSLHHRTLALLLEVLPRPVTAAVRCALLIVWSVLNAFGKAYVVA